jgi:hypothetical protein
MGFWMLSFEQIVSFDVSCNVVLDTKAVRGAHTATQKKREAKEGSKEKKE